MDKENFNSYYNQHYKPLLEKLTDLENKTLQEEDRRLLSFLKEDIEKLFIESAD